MITVEAVYVHGVLKPVRKLDLAEGAKVELRIAAVPKQPGEAAGGFESLAGIWSYLPDNAIERLDAALIYMRQQTTQKLDRFVHQLRDGTGEADENLPG